MKSSLERKRDSAQKYYLAHKEEVLARTAKYRKENPEKVKLKNIMWANSHPDKMKAYIEKYHLTGKGRFAQLKKRAKDAKIPMEIKQTDFCEWYLAQEKKCHYCELKLVSDKGTLDRLSTPSIDRKNNDEGYVLANIALCCNRCNLIKGSWFSEKQMLEIANKYLRVIEQEVKHD